ncbi:unnamed protein product [Prorocentrum cordatum]|uniref:Uncharacterized protein n=1 Tax=Prorocentrum cordatum TaxID=2364126 RepID=A0ABN9UX73_9DINO|nr:unnamed protein product [Polarella glacialis]
MQVGCANEFEAFAHFYKDTGMFGFYIECDEVAVEHAVGELMFGMNLLSFSVTEEEVARGQRELKNALCSATNSTESACANLGKERSWLTVAASPWRRCSSASRRSTPRITT